MQLNKRTENQVKILCPLSHIANTVQGLVIFTQKKWHSFTMENHKLIKKNANQTTYFPRNFCLSLIFIVFKKDTSKSEILAFSYLQACVGVNQTYLAPVPSLSYRKYEILPRTIQYNK